MRSNKDSFTLVIVSAGLLLSVVVSVWLWRSSGERARRIRALDHTISNAETRMLSIQAVLERYALLERRLPGKSAHGPWTLNGGELFEDMKSVATSAELLVDERMRKEILTDPWSNYYHIRFQPASGDAISAASELCTVFVWSSGPNRDNELGGGDDISLGAFEITISAVPSDR
jgi:hypothetical protein